MTKPIKSRIESGSGTHRKRHTHESNAKPSPLLEQMPSREEVTKALCIAFRQPLYEAAKHLQEAEERLIWMSGLAQQCHLPDDLDRGTSLQANVEDVLNSLDDAEQYLRELQSDVITGAKGGPPVRQP